MDKLKKDSGFGNSANLYLKMYLDLKNDEEKKELIDYLKSKDEIAFKEWKEWCKTKGIIID